jgi:hypothetical protein
VPSILSIHSSRMAVCRAGNFNKQDIGGKELLVSVEDSHECSCVCCFNTTEIKYAFFVIDRIILMLYNWIFLHPSPLCKLSFCLKTSALVLLLLHPDRIIVTESPSAYLLVHFLSTRSALWQFLSQRLARPVKRVSTLKLIQQLLGCREYN